MSFQEQTLTIKLFLYEVEKVKKDKYPVYARIIYRREKADISMHLMANIKDWDFENQMFLPSNPSNRYNNNKLLSTKDEITEIFKELKNGDSYFSVKTIKQKYRGEPTEYSTMKFLEYYDSYVDDCKKRPAEYGEGVMGHYKKTRRHLVNYMTSKGIVNITLNKLSRNFIVGFEQHLLSTLIKGKEYAMNRNTATTYIKKLKASINRALDKELIVKNPFSGYKSPRFKVSKITYLNNEELDAICAHDLGNNLSLIKVKDLFLFSCYTGLRFSDAIKLKGQDITKDKKNVFWLRISQQKTKDIIDVPMLDLAIEIYEKYKLHREETGFVLPQLSHSKVNTHLKIIGGLAGVKKVLTHHVARHTFATTITLEQGIDLKTVSKLLGHTSIKSTEIYAQVSKKKLTDVVETLNKKLSV